MKPLSGCISSPFFFALLKQVVKFPQKAVASAKATSALSYFTNNRPVFGFLRMILTSLWVSEVNQGPKLSLSGTAMVGFFFGTSTHFLFMCFPTTVFVPLNLAQFGYEATQCEKQERLNANESRAYSHTGEVQEKC